MHNDLEKILITKEQIDERVTELATQITRHYQNSDLVLIGVLKGCMNIMKDLSNKLPFKHVIDFLGTASYGSKTSSTGHVRLTKDLDTDIEGKDVILIEDIYDTGNTLNFIFDLLKAHKPKSLELLAFLNKPTRHEYYYSVKYVGFEIPNEFVIGYGLDYNEFYRNLDCIGVLKKELIQIEE